MIEKQKEQKQLLNGCSNAVDYIANRLNWDQIARENALKNCPALVKCNMLKVRKSI